MLTSGRVVREDGSGPSLASGPIDLPELAFLQNSFAPLDSTFTEDFLFFFGFPTGIRTHWAD
jgi:hypothetical protein